MLGNASITYFNLLLQISLWYGSNQNMLAGCFGTKRSRISRKWRFILLNSLFGPYNFSLYSYYLSLFYFYFLCTLMFRPFFLSAPAFAADAIVYKVSLSLPKLEVSVYQERKSFLTLCFSDYYLISCLLLLFGLICAVPNPNEGTI